VSFKQQANTITADCSKIKSSKIKKQHIKSLKKLVFYKKTTPQLKHYNPTK